jgi:hypothetical protein
MRRHLALLTATALTLAGLPMLGSQSSVPRVEASRLAASGSVAKVRAIIHTLLVAPPKKHYAKGKVKQSLNTREALKTGKADLASLGFNDGTILHLNQDTEATLASPTVTKVTNGEVDQILQPGTTHVVQTAVATASAIGTEFDTACTPGICVFTVVEGAVLITSKAGGSVLLKNNQQSSVRKGSPPSPPITVDAAAIVAWAHPLPPPPPTLGINLSLDANGGFVIPSTTRDSPNQTWNVAHVHDGSTTSGWQTAQGHTSNESLTFSFPHGDIYAVSAVVIDPAATGGEPAENDLKDFVVKASRDGKPYSTVMTGTVQATDSLQRFVFPASVDADHIQLALVDNNGGADGIAVAEAELVGQRVAVATPLPTPTFTPTPRPTNTPVPQNRLWKINAFLPTVTYNSGDQIQGNDRVQLQSCGFTPTTNSWTGTYFENDVDLVSGESQNFTEPLSIKVKPNVPVVAYDTGQGFSIDLTYLPGAVGAPGSMKVDINEIPANDPVPPVLTDTEVITDGGPCTP